MINLPLNEKKIRQTLLNAQSTTLWRFHLLSSINSTNTYLKEYSLAQDTAVDVCCAEEQTQGRGRFGRHWHSPFGENIYCSIRWDLPYKIAKLTGLSLVTGLAILNCLKELHPKPGIQIKWPNDLIWNKKKLGGILIEILEQSTDRTQFIIGVGLNANLGSESLQDKPWCSLHQLVGQSIDRNQLIGQLLIKIESYLHRLITHGFSDFIDEWNKVDYLAGQQVTVTQSLKRISGKACGVNQEGLLLLEEVNGIRHCLSSGDTTLQNEIRPEQD